MRSSIKGYSIVLLFRIDVAHKSYTLHKTLFASIIWGGGGISSDVKVTDNRQSLLLQLIIYIVVIDQKGEMNINNILKTFLPKGKQLLKFSSLEQSC